MPRRSKGPVYYASKQAWFANIKGEAVKLLEGAKTATEKEAWERYEKVKQALETQVAGDKSPVWAVLNAYLRHAETRSVPPPLAPNTYRIHRLAIANFCEFDKTGQLPVRDLKMADINRWVAERKKEKLWSENYAHLQMRVLRTAFLWAANEGEYISESPFARKGKKFRLGTADLKLKRLSITDEEHAILLAQAGRRRKGNFADLLRFLHGTGARPAELYLARAEEWDPKRQAIVIDSSDPANIGRLKTRRHLKKTGRNRVIRVPDELVPLVLPNGHLFFMEDGRPYQNAGKAADRLKSLIRTVNKKAGKTVVRKGVSLYSYRHAFVTRFLSDGGNVMLLCELLNTSIEMIQAHYSHLLDSDKALLDALNKFGKSPSSPRKIDPCVVKPDVSPSPDGMEDFPAQAAAPPELGAS